MAGRVHQIRQMLDDIEKEVRYTSRFIGRDALSREVMQAMRSVPRDQFVPADCIDSAFVNAPLHIGHGQTISQPYIVALMTDLLRLDEEDTVLEVGTGSGYQTAVLSELCRKVYTIEYIPTLARTAQARLQRLGYDNIEYRTGNGYEGWPEHAPYAGIIVTAAASHIPAPLLEQLKPGGRMIIPIGLPYRHQELTVVVREADGKVDIFNVLGVAFVPLQGEPENKRDGPEAAFSSD